MGARKAIKAEKIKAEKKQKAIAVLRDCPTSPRKMRLVADIIRGVEINKALGILRYSKKQASIRLEKLLRSAISKQLRILSVQDQSRSLLISTYMRLHQQNPETAEIAALMNNEEAIKLTPAEQQSQPADAIDRYIRARYAEPSLAAAA